MSANNNKKILIVDDDAEFRIMLINLITAEDHNYDIIEAANGREAIDQICTHDVDLIITDVEMPHMDGMEFIKELKKTIHLNIPLIVTSGDPKHIQLFEVADMLKSTNFISKESIPKHIVPLILKNF